MSESRNPLAPPAADCPACEAATAFTPSSLSRRLFLRSGAMALVGAALVPEFLARAAAAAGTQGAKRRRVLVTVFLRGAADGVSMLVPYREAEYYRLRRTIAVPAPGRVGGDDASIDLDGTFALHPALQPLQPLYAQRRLAFVVASGSPDATRSHFDAQDFMESAAPGNRGVRDGWLNRMLAAQPAAHETSFRAIAMSTQVPRALQGTRAALAIPNLQEFGVRGGNAAVQKGFEGMYEGAVRDTVRGTGHSSLDAVDRVRQQMTRRPCVAENGAVYPTNPFGRQMQQAAWLIKADLGVEVVAAEMGGWDTHANQGAATGQLANNLRVLAQTLAAFARDLGDLLEDVVVLTMSEFGRTLAENGSRGTDHGHGNLNMVLGGRVRGGRIYGRWPGLAPEQRFEGRDLAVTTDFRDVFAEVMQRHMGCGASVTVFPGHTVSVARFPGVLA